MKVLGFFVALVRFFFILLRELFVKALEVLLDSHPLPSR